MGHGITYYGYMTAGLVCLAAVIPSERTPATPGSGCRFSCFCCYPTPTTLLPRATDQRAAATAYTAHLPRAARRLTLVVFLFDRCLLLRYLGIATPA